MRNLFYSSGICRAIFFSTSFCPTRSTTRWGSASRCAAFLIGGTPNSCLAAAVLLACFAFGNESVFGQKIPSLGGPVQETYEDQQDSVHDTSEPGMNDDPQIDFGHQCWISVRYSAYGYSYVLVEGTGNDDDVYVDQQGDNITVGIRDRRTLKERGECVFSQSAYNISELRIYTYDGDDSVDVLCDGTVYVRVTAGNGDDTILIRGGCDCGAKGNAGNDFIAQDGGIGSNIQGGAGCDLIMTSGGFWLPGGDVGCRGGEGDDLMIASGIGKLMWGENGNDIMRMESGAAGGGMDGGNGDDFLEASDVGSLLYGGSGNDVLLGSYGDDTIRGGCGDDVIFGGDGEDDLDADSGNDLIVGGGDGDQIAAGTGADMVFAADSDRDRIDLGHDLKADIVAADYNDVVRSKFSEDYVFLSILVTIQEPSERDYQPDLSKFETLFPGLFSFMMK